VFEFRAADALGLERPVCRRDVGEFTVLDAADDVLEGDGVAGVVSRVFRSCRDEWTGTSGHRYGFTPGAPTSGMSEQVSDAVIRHSTDIDYETVEAADGLRKGVLIGEEQGAPNLAIRRFTLAPGGKVPRHTNEIEHEQYVLAGEYVVGVGDEEHTVTAGDSLHIPAGVVHWYRNDGEEEGAFICAVPTGDDEINLVE